MRPGTDLSISQLTTQLRVDSIRCSTAAGSGYLTSSLSAADLMAVLLVIHLLTRLQAEGSMWEALDKASHYRIANLTAIIDVNRRGQRGPTELGWDLEVHRRRIEAFGCRALLVDGHDVEAIDATLTECRQDGEHVGVVPARIVKGRGVKEPEDAESWHGRALPVELAERVTAVLGEAVPITVTSHRPPPSPPYRKTAVPGAISLPRYEFGALVATRLAFGDALQAPVGHPEVVVLDGEVANSTYAEELAAACPDYSFETLISEQQMIGAAVGQAARGYRSFASASAAFVSRAADFFRMAASSKVRVRINGSHADVEIGADGRSQMGLEDLALMQAIKHSTVPHLSDATSAAELTAAMIDLGYICYLWTPRAAYPVLYGSDEAFPVGGAKVLRPFPYDDVRLVGVGVAVHQFLDAANDVVQEGISARVIDAYSVKPMETSALLDACESTSGRLVVAEGHHPEGGLGAAVALAISGREASSRTVHLAVRAGPMSGTSTALLEYAGISAYHIRAAAHALVGRS